MENCFEILNNMPVGICVIDNDMNIVYANHQMQNFTDLKFVGKNKANLISEFPNFGLMKYKLRISEVFKSGTPVVFSYQLHRDLFETVISKPYYVLQTTVSALKKFSSERILAMITVENNTEIFNQMEQSNMLKYKALKEIEQNKKLTKQLIDEKEKVQQSESLKTAFIRNISHEVRTPLNAILGYSDILLNIPVEEKNRELYLNIINNNGQKLLDLFSTIIDYSLAESKTLDLCYENVSINDIMDNLYSQYSIEIIESEKSHELINDNKGSKDIVTYSDKKRIFQIMKIFISNALKFSFGGKILYGCTTEENQLLFYVEDEGIGISKQIENKIFDRFFQEDSSLTRNTEGVGISLALAKELVHCMGGNIGFKNQKDLGTIFYFTLPLKSKKQFETKKIIDNPKLLSDIHKSVILVVDDDTQNYELIKEYYSDFELTFLYAETAEQALDFVKYCPEVNLMICELALPDMNGLELIKKVQQLKIDLPIVVCIGFVDSEIHGNCKKLGCELIPKPIDFEIFHEKILKHLIQLQNEKCHA